MSVTEKKEADSIEQFKRQADEAKKTLISIQENIQSKTDLHSRTLNLIKDKCKTQFETQYNNWQKYEEKNEERQNTFSLRAVTKYNKQTEKSREIAERTHHSIEYLKTKNEERFQTRDAGLDNADRQRKAFLRKERERKEGEDCGRS